VCLTAVDPQAGSFSADLAPETLLRSNLGDLRAGSRVNLERPLSPSGRLSGHIVQGHVDGVGRITRLDPEGENWWLGVRVPDEIARYVAMKGSIAIDGISLTVAGWHDGIVEIAIIPFTYAQTNLGKAVVGNAVNLECDVLAKYIERLLEAREQTPQSRLTIDRLKAEGF